MSAVTSQPGAEPSFVLRGRVVTPDEVLADGVVVVQGVQLRWVGPAADVPEPWRAALPGATADTLLLLDGQIAPDAYISGQDVSAWVKANQASSATRGAKMSASEIASRQGAFDPKTLSPLLKGTPQKKKAHPLAQRRERAKALADSLGPGNATVQQRFAAN